MGIGMAIGMLLFWGLIITAIVMLARGFGGRPAASELRMVWTPPLDILGERYARGEIDKGEYEIKRRDLEGSGGMPKDKQRREFPDAGGGGAP